MCSKKKNSAHSLIVLLFQAEWKESHPSSPLPPLSGSDPALPPSHGDKDAPPKKVKARPPPLKRPFDSVDKYVS